MKEFTTDEIMGSADWVEVDAINVTIPGNVLDNIQVARDIIKSTDFIDSITIKAGMSEVIQYQSNNIDGVDKLEELPYEDLSHFRISKEEIKVSAIDAYYVMHNKYTNDYLEVEIPE